MLNSQADHSQKAAKAGRIARAVTVRIRHLKQAAIIAAKARVAFDISREMAAHLSNNGKSNVS